MRVTLKTTNENRSKVIKLLRQKHLRFSICNHRIEINIVKPRNRKIRISESLNKIKLACR